MFVRAMLRTLSAALVLSALLLGGTGPAVAQKKPKTAPARAYDSLNTTAAGHDLVNSYLLCLASHYVYADLSGVKTTDTAGFVHKFTDRFHGYGMTAVQYISNKGTDTECVVMSNTKAVVLVFRGSEPGDPESFVKDYILNDAVIILKDVPALGAGVEVHLGNWKGLDSVYAAVKSEVRKQGGFKGKKVFVTGHSLGGALATVCGLRLHKDGTGKATVYTFGAPRAGNDRFQSAYKGLTLFRWVNRSDLVPMVPDDVVLGYRHVGVTNNILDNGKLGLNASERRGVGNPMMHHVPLYANAIYNNLPPAKKQHLPKPPRTK
jgi:hypothetical protein